MKIYNSKNSNLKYTFTIIFTELLSVTNLLELSELESEGLEEIPIADLTLVNEIMAENLDY